MKLPLTAPTARPRRRAFPVALAALVLAANPSYAVDGCKVLLCLAAPDWRQISECVPTIEQLHRDLRRGRPFPRCSMAGAGNDAQLQASFAPGGCPPQYTVESYGENGPVYSCAYSNVISVSVAGQPWTQVWWNIGGDSVTEFLPAAKAQLGFWNTRFDAEYEAWRASQPSEPSPSESNGG